MSSVDMPERIFAIAWAFQVAAENCEEFERAYGPNGDWVKLFRTAEGYVRTTLHRDRERPGTYITLDFWGSREQYEAFKQQASAAYLEIDAKCESLTEDERLLGEFETQDSLRAAFPKLGISSEVRSAVTTRDAVSADIPVIIHIERSAASAAHWSEERYAAIFGADAPLRLAMVAEIDNRQLCGFVIARLAADECELENIVVLPQQTRQGIGSTLLQKLVQTAREKGLRRISLEVRQSNDPARELYRRFGFAEEGFRQRYYRDPSEDAVVYCLELDSTSH